MNNIFKYIEEFKDCTFEAVPFNEVDSLILCQLAYLDYSLFVSGISKFSKPVCIGDILESDDVKSLFLVYWEPGKNRKFFEAVARSKRFRDLKLNFYKQIFEEDKDTQFAAMTYILPDKSVYVAFRGTDATLIGWKEDMKLAYSKPLRSQELATEYLNKVSECFGGKFHVGGHSKGGNLAVYSAMYCNSTVQDRIIDIYSHDGPGFRPEVVKAGNIDRIADRIHKFIPKSSIVGIIMEQDIDFEVVDCFGIGTFQHNPFMWKYKGTSFVRKPKMSDTKIASDKNLNEWIYSLSEEEVDTFIETVFGVLSASNAKNLFDIMDDPVKAVYYGMDKFMGRDIKSKETLEAIFKRYVEIVGKNTWEEILSKMKKVKKNEILDLPRKEDK